MWTHLIACLLIWLETNVTTFVPVRVSGEHLLLVCWSARYGETLWISVTNVTTFVPVLVPFFAGLLVGSVWRGFVDTSHKCYKFRFCCFALPFDHPAEEGERRWVEHFRSDLGPMWLEFVISSLACPWLCLPNSLHVPYGTWRKASCFCFLLLFTSVFVMTPLWYLIVHYCKKY